MATVLSRVGELVSLNYTESDVNQQSSCNYCFKYKCELEELTQELLSAKKIIQLLEEDRNTYKDPTAVRTSDDRSNSHVSSNLLLLLSSGPRAYAPDAPQPYRLIVPP